ncbi:MAG TPA: hypothetical protein VNP72_11385, partial [Longimicrobium sp.]|nr:hypothetical protein [Longimicrobium sp.]
PSDLPLVNGPSARPAPAHARRQPRGAEPVRQGRWDGMPPERFDPRQSRAYGDSRGGDGKPDDAALLPSRGGRRGIGSLADLAGAMGTGGAAWPAPGDAEPGSFARWDDHFPYDEQPPQDQPDLPRAPEPSRAPPPILPHPDDHEPPREKEPAGLDFPARARADAGWEAPRPARGAVRGLGDLASLAGPGGLDLGDAGAGAGRAPRNSGHAEPQRTQREDAEGSRGSADSGRSSGEWETRREDAGRGDWAGPEERVGDDVAWTRAALTRRERGHLGAEPGDPAGAWDGVSERRAVPVGWIYPPQETGNGSAFPFTDPPASPERAEPFPAPESGDVRGGGFALPRLESVPAQTHAELRGLRGRREAVPPSLAPPRQEERAAAEHAPPRGPSAAAILAAVGQVRAEEPGIAPAASPASPPLPGSPGSPGTPAESAAQVPPPLLGVETEAASGPRAATPGIDVDELMDALSREIGREYRRFYGQ